MTSNKVSDPIAPFLVVLGLTPSCASFRPADAGELARVLAATAPIAEARSATGEVTIESESLRGTFSAVLASEPNGRVRLQLFPDVGGKILDLFASSERIKGVIPQAQISYDHDPRGGSLPRHVLLFFAITLLESATPIARERVLGARTRDGVLEVLLAPRVPECEVVAEIGSDGSLVARDYVYRHVGWRERIGAKTVVTGSGFRLEARVLETSPLTPEEVDAAFRRLP